MSALNISKGQGAVLCLVITIPYEILYYKYFGHNEWTKYLLLFFTTGVLLHFFHKIEPGTRAELVFFGKVRNFFWEDGYCLVPSVLPILHHVGIYFLWSLKKENYLHTYRNDRDVSIEHFQDQRRPRYNVNTETSMFGMAMSRISEGMIGWFFQIKKGDEGLLFQRLGSRMIILSILLGFFANILYSNNNPNSTQSATPDSSSPTSGAYDSQKKSYIKLPEGTIRALILLRHGQDPILPTEENFLPRKNGPINLYFLMGDSDPRKYFLFQEPNESGKTILFINESLCAIVPAGRKIFFITKYPPQNVVNMELNVVYAKKEERYGIVDRIRRRISGSLWSENTSWRYLYDNWSDVETEKHYIVAKALPREKLPEPEKSFGGIVCF